MIHLGPVLVVVALLAGAGVFGLLARRNAVLTLIGVELLLAAATLLLVAVDAVRRDPVHGGQVTALFVITIAAAEVGVALAVVVLHYRSRGHVDLDEATELGELSPSRAVEPVAGEAE